MLDLYRYSLEPGQPAEMRVFSSSPGTAIIVTPARTEVTCPLGSNEKDRYRATFPDTAIDMKGDRLLEEELFDLRWPKGFPCPRWLHKMRRAMVRPGRVRLRGEVEVDEGCLGGREEGVHGRETFKKALVAVVTAPAPYHRLNQHIRPGPEHPHHKG